MTNIALGGFTIFRGDLPLYEVFGQKCPIVCRSHPPAAGIFEDAANTYPSSKNFIMETIQLAAIPLPY